MILTTNTLPMPTPLTITAYLLAVGFVSMLVMHKLNSDTIEWLRGENDRLKRQLKINRNDASKTE